MLTARRVVRYSRLVPSNHWCLGGRAVLPSYIFGLHRDLSTKEEVVESKGFVDKWFGIDSCIAKKDANRWFFVAPAFITHMCIGAPWAFSIVADTITREYGFVAAAPGDWSLMESAFPMSMVFLMMGVSASVKTLIHLFIP